MDPESVRMALASNYEAMSAIAVFLDTCEDPLEIMEAARDMDLVLRETESILRRVFSPILPRSPGSGASIGASSRLPRRSGVILSASEVLDALETSVGLVRMEAEILLGKSVNEIDDVEFTGIKARTDYLIAFLGSIARYYKKAIVANHPGFWTDILEKQFEKYLKIKPPR